MIVQLEDVGFQWIYDSQLIHNTAWNERLSELLEFKQQWGHYNVPQKYAKNPKLSNWVNRQRKQYELLKSGKNSLINNERIVQLEMFGFKWEKKSATQQTICDKNSTCLQ